MIKKVFPILALCVFSSTLGIGVVAPILPLYIRDMGATQTWLGIIVSAYFISNSVVVPIAGRLSDQKGRKLLLTIGLLAYSIISLGYVWADNVALLALVRLFHGIAGAMTIPIAMAYLGDISPRGEEGKWMGYANGAFFSGFGFGPLLGGLVSEHFGMTFSFLIMSGLNLIAFFIALFFLHEVTDRKSSDGVRLSLKEITSNNMLRGLFSYRLAEAIGRGGITTFLPIFGTMLGLSVSLIGLLISVNILSVTLFAPIAGRIADKFNRRTLTQFGILIFTILLAVIPLTTTFWQLLFVLVAQGLNAAISMSASTALGVEEGRKFGMGSTMSILFLAMGMGMTAGPIMSGGVAEMLNINWVFYFVAVIGFIGVGLFTWFTRGYRRWPIAFPESPG